MPSAGNPPGPVEPAAHLGKYRLIAEIARGGMGVVHLAVLKGPAGFTKLLVVKELRSELVDNDVFVAMFFEEARLAARLSHPNVVQTLEVGSDDRRHFLAMEYIEGHSLQRLARRAHRRGRPIPLSVHLYLLIEILTALEYAHSLTERDGSHTGLVHRDVSPHNVLVTYDGHVKLVDFGIAKTVAAIHDTHAGLLKGKMMYMAPEQAACEPVDRRADVFSAGLVLWEAVVGHRPWEGRSEAAILRSLLAGEIPRLRDALPEVDANMAAIVERATSAEPADRYPTALAMREDLENYRDRLTCAPAAARELGALVSELFAQDRRRLEGLVETQVRQLGERRRSRVSSFPPPPPAVPVSDEPEAFRAADAPFRSLAPSAIWDPPAEPAPRRGRLVAGALVIVAAGVVAAFVVVTARRASPDRRNAPVATAAHPTTNASTSLAPPIESRMAIVEEAAPPAPLAVVPAVEKPLGVPTKTGGGATGGPNPGARPAVKAAGPPPLDRPATPLMPRPARPVPLPWPAPPIPTHAQPPQPANEAPATSLEAPERAPDRAVEAAPSSPSAP